MCPAQARPFFRLARTIARERASAHNERTCVHTPIQYMYIEMRARVYMYIYCVAEPREYKRANVCLGLYAVCICAVEEEVEEWPCLAVYGLRA